MVGAAISGLLSVANRYLGWQTSLLIFPVIYWIYRSYRLYLGRLEDEKKHVEDMAGLHLRTIEALALAIEAKDDTTHRKLGEMFSTRRIAKTYTALVHGNLTKDNITVNLPIAREALNLLGRKAPPPPQPWPDDLRATLVRVLATGPPAIAALEAIDQRHLLERYLPEWTAVRNKPQRNPYHRFTVDRHLLEATANAATLAHRVSRVDLLLLGTLLHDIGKGFSGDHTDVGMKVVADVGARIGLPSDDVDTLVTLVRLHLLLPDTATRRDLDDPATAERVAKEVGSRSTLDLLAALVEADSLATGPSAWGSWKAGLVAELVERASRLLAGEPATPPTPWITDDLRVIMDTVRVHGVPALSVDDPTVTVVAGDRPGLFAEVTGVLALHGLNVRSAVVAGEDGVAVEIFTVEPSRGRWPAAARLADDLAGVMDGSLSIESQLAERARTYRNERRAIPPHLVSTQVSVDNNASATASVVEVRAEDVVGQLHRITQALVDCRLDVSSAKVSTFGSAVVDAFYVHGPDGGKLTDQQLIAEVEGAIRNRIESSPPGAATG